MFVSYLGKRNSINLLCDVSNPNHYMDLGIEVIFSFNNSFSFNDVENAHGVTLNVVQNSDYFVSFAKFMKSNFGIPYILLTNESCSIEDLRSNLEATAKYLDL